MRFLVRNFYNRILNVFSECSFVIVFLFFLVIVEIIFKVLIIVLSELLGFLEVMLG